MKLLLSLLLLTGLLQATPPSISQSKLDSLVHKWQKVLRLQDWDIRAVAVRLEDLPEDTWGASHFDTLTRVCHIGVLDPQDYERAATANETVPKRGKAIRRDIEDTIVHELVHLRLKALMEADVPNLKITEEMTVNRFTSALLRGGK